MRVRDCMVLYGHGARVWNGCWIRNTRIWERDGGGAHELLLLTCAEDLMCMLWEIETGMCIAKFKGTSGMRNTQSVRKQSKEDPMKVRVEERVEQE